MRKGEKIMEILAILAGGALMTAEILDELWPTGFTRSYNLNRNRQTEFLKRDFEVEQRQKFYRLLSHLKSEGFIEKKKSQEQSIWKITLSGLNKLQLLKNKSINYRADEDGSMKIIVFDVPEKERRLRGWLRDALRILGFKMLQQSVWMGKKKIPEQFLHDLRQRKLLPHVQILEVNKKGTIKELA